jgi:hypothetical protein
MAAPTKIVATRNRPPARPIAPDAERLVAVTMKIVVTRKIEIGK